MRKYRYYVSYYTKASEWFLITETNCIIEAMDEYNYLTNFGYALDEMYEKKLECDLNDKVMSETEYEYGYDSDRIYFDSLYKQALFDRDIADL